MTIFDVLKLLCGLALFLFGMEIMSDSLKKSAGNRLKSTLEKMTSSKLKGFLLGAGVTALIQSCSATTVMIVGFVNSGTMTLSQSVGVIMGSNVGAGITAWITGLSGIGSGSTVTSIVEWLKPTTWMPLLAMVGIGLLIFGKRGKKKDIGFILLGFSVLMVGMELMSESVAGLKEDEGFKSILTMFQNPLLGLLTGIVVTAAIQSSGASVGILQSLTATGVITYRVAIPIVMGQNIGTCITALISSAGATKNGKRAALIHLYYNVISAVVLLGLYVLFDWIFKFAFLDLSVGTMGIAAIHTVFKLLSVLLFAPFTKQLEKLAYVSVRGGDDNEEINLLDERLLRTPSVALERAGEVMRTMEQMSFSSMADSLSLLYTYDAKSAENIRILEDKVDVCEDALGTYLVKINTEEMEEHDSHEATKLLHLIGDFERISDHSVNIVESAEEIRDKKIEFSKKAQTEIGVLTSAVKEILELTGKAYEENDLDVAAKVEPLEQTIDYLCTTIKSHHIERLQNNECTIEHGFVLSDIITNCERVSDHCSNIAGLIIEMTKDDAMNMHSYLNSIKKGGEEFEKEYNLYMEKYSI